MKFTDFLLIVIIVVGAFVGYDYYNTNRQDLVQPVAPLLYSTPDAPVIVNTVQSPPLPTWTPQSINFQATTDAYLDSLPTQTPVVLVATRPAFETLPPQGPYTVEQIETCRATWDQHLEGQLSMFQQQYELCYSALLGVGYFN